MPRASVTASRRASRRAAAGRAGGAATDGALNAKLHTPISEETVKRVWQVVKQHNIKVVDLKFNDLPGLWQHFSIPIE